MKKFGVAESPVLPKYMPQFDGLRAIAVLGVVFYHLNVQFETLKLGSLVQFGWAGVDLFFVLSGFLITGILLESKGAPNYFRTFYTRRALRIWPLYYAFLLFVFTAAPLVQSSLRAEFSTRHWWYYALYIQNLVFDRFPFSLTWSLAVEEQFYCVFPLIVWLCSRKALRNGLIAVIVLSPVLRMVALHCWANWDSLYLATPYRLHGLAIGGLAALWLRSESCTLRRWQVSSLLFFGVGLPCSLFSLIGAPDHGQSTILGYTWLSLMFVGAVGLALFPPPFLSGITKVLNLRPLQFIGKISYGVYLLHLPVLGGILALLARKGIVAGGDSVISNLAQIVALLAAAIGTAALSWYLFERHILRLKRHFRYGSEKQEQPMPVAMAAAAGADRG